MQSLVNNNIFKPNILVLNTEQGKSHSGELNMISSALKLSRVESVRFKSLHRSCYLIKIFYVNTHFFPFTYYIFNTGRIENLLNFSARHL